MKERLLMFLLEVFSDRYTLDYIIDGPEYERDIIGRSRGFNIGRLQSFKANYRRLQKSENAISAEETIDVLTAILLKRLWNCGASDRAQKADWLIAQLMVILQKSEDAAKRGDVR